MATPIEALQNKRDQISASLSSSPTAYGSVSGEPSSYDLSLDKQLASVNKQIEDAKSKQLRTTWYGPSTTGEAPAEDIGGSDGIIMGGLKMLSRPLNAIMGATQYALGKGTESSLGANMNQAMKSGLTAGNILQQYGAPRAVQIPLGFALDVMFDPVTWLTAGTSALIPRFGTGLVKGTIKGGVKQGFEAAGEGLASNLAKKASTVMKFVPVGKLEKMGTVAEDLTGAAIKEGTARSALVKTGGAYNELAEKLAKKAITGGEKYDALIGENVYNRLGRGILGEKSGVISSTAEELVKKIPSFKVFGKATPTGEKIVDFLKYSPKNAAEIADVKDKAYVLSRNEGYVLVKGKTGFDFETLAEARDPNAFVMRKQQIKEVADGIVKEVEKEVPVAIRNADGTLKPEFLGDIKIKDSAQNAKALLGISVDDSNMKNLIESAYKIREPGKTGVQWYDNAIEELKGLTMGDIVNKAAKPFGKGDILERVQKEGNELVQTWNKYGKVMDLKPFEKIMNAYPEYISIFKAAKVPMNVASHVVANVGNFFMGALMGLPVWDPKFYASLRRASGTISGSKGIKGIKEIFYNDVNSFIDMMENHPNRFKQMTGMDVADVQSKLALVDNLRNMKGAGVKEVKDYLARTFEDVAKGEKIGEAATAHWGAEFEKTATKAEKDLLKKSLPTPSESEKIHGGGMPLPEAEKGTDFASSEIYTTKWVDKMMTKVADQAKAKPNNPVIQAANLLVNKMPKWYEQIDQTWKLGTTDYLTHVGVNEEALKIMSRSTEITKDDLLNPLGEIVGAEKIYKLKPLKASEVAMEAFMNYSAMPDAVRILRALPVLGSSFFSFPYAMAIKTGKTAIDNPAIFNKIGFMINEMNAARTPQERAAMESDYNSYLKSPTIVKLFGTLNTDVKNFIPYYTMNMFNPSLRNYGTDTASKLLEMSDKFPILQDPIGAIWKDYVLQPWILSGSGQSPQGQFGQPLYPSYDASGNKIDASFGTKLFYGGRSLAETVVPGSLGYLGVANAPLGLSADTVDWIPSYGARSVANATQGRSSIGAMTKEDAVRKTLRSLFGRTGIPAYNLDITKSSQ